MWLAGGAAVVLAAVVLVVATVLEDDRWGATPRRTGIVTAEELRAADPPVAWRGYHRGHVDALLARAATTLEQVEHYGVLDQPSDAEDAPVRSRAVGPPSFLADAFRPTEATSPAAAPGDDGGGHDGGGEGPASGEELEDGGGDDTGGLDR